MHKDQLVLVLHGLGNSRNIMAALSWFLQRQGFSVLNLSYPSCKYSISQLTAIVLTQLDDHLRQHHYSSINIVGFSLGSQIARLLVEEHCGRLHFSRVVMLGPPNQGAAIARYLSKVLPTSKIWGPVFEELCGTDLPNPSSKVEIGIIAGVFGARFGINPFLGEDNDGLVTLSETFLKGAKEHKTVFAPHGSMPLQPNVMKMTANFLKTGSFL